MAQPFVAGPAYLYVGVGQNYAPVFLGTAERTPRIQERSAWGEVYNDVAGSKIPFDYIYEGSEGFVSCVLTRWNEPVFAAIAARPRASSAGSARGVNVPGDLGTLMISEGFAYPLWVQFPYQRKAAYASQPPGYHFSAAWLEGPDDLNDNGTVARKIQLIWHCGRAYSFSGGSANNFGVGTFSLYDTLAQSFAGLPNPD